MKFPDLPSARSGPQAGWVYLVGAGPGDPELLTRRGARRVAGADVLLYDNLVSPEILALARADAEQIYVGKKAADHSLPQEAINALLLDKARAGHSVVRLKGGDPFIFGRGGEEMDVLVGQGVAVEVVPGVTAAAGVAAYAGIPLTHREHAQAVVFATGFLKNGALDLDWPALARPHQTVVFYMGITRLAEICSQLVAHGLPATMPAAVVERGTTQAQRVIGGTLADLAARASEAGVRPPALTIVGSVVSLHPKLAWFTPTAQPQPDYVPHAGCSVVHGNT